MIAQHRLAAWLTGALVLGSVGTAWISMSYYSSVGELQRLQAQYGAINNARTAAQALANDAVEYSKRNPSIDPLLFQFEIKQKPTAAAPAPTVKPAPKPGTK